MAENENPYLETAPGPIDATGILFAGKENEPFMQGVYFLWYSTGIKGEVQQSQRAKERSVKKVLGDFAAVGNGLGHSQQAELVPALGGKHHAVGHQAPDLARRQIQHGADLFAHQIIGGVIFRQS